MLVQLPSALKLGFIIALQDSHSQDWAGGIAVTLCIAEWPALLGRKGDLQSVLGGEGPSPEGRVLEQLVAELRTSHVDWGGSGHVSGTLIYVLPRAREGDAISTAR